MRLFSFFKSQSALNQDYKEDENEAFIPYSPHDLARFGTTWRKYSKELKIIAIILASLSFTFNIIFTVAFWGFWTVPSPRLQWSTEIGPPFASLETERVQFDAGLELNRNGELIRTSISGKNAPKFVGDPTDEIDSNWEFLIPSDMNITRGEAKQIGGDFYFYPNTDIATIELSTFHILHCLDQIRKSVYHEHYWPNGVSKPQRVHVDHCIDIVRQYIQCHVDLTPINLVWSENKGGILPNFQQLHVCQSYRKAHEWVLRRNIANYENGIGDEGVADDARQTLKHFGWE